MPRRRAVSLLVASLALAGLLLGPGSRCAQAEPRDPRETLAILLIADRPEWSAWLLPVLRTLSEETGSKIWTSYLEARIREASGDVNGMTAVVDRLVEKHRRFGPAHEWSIELSEARNPAEPMHPEVVRARRMRLASLGAELIDDPVEVALAEASDLARRNDNASAVAKLRSVLAEAGDSEVEARLILGILMIRASQPSFAANYLHDAALGDPGIFQTVVVDSLLYSLRYAVKAEEDGIKQRGAIGKARALEMLGELSERYPLDPCASRGSWARSAASTRVSVQARPNPASAARMADAALALGPDVQVGTEEFQKADRSSSDG